MSVCCKFDGGKQYNCRIQAGSFQHRCDAAHAGLEVQNGLEWPLQFWQQTTGSDPGTVMTSYMKSKEEKLNNNRFGLSDDLTVAVIVHCIDISFTLDCHLHA